MSRNSVAAVALLALMALGAVSADLVEFGTAVTSFKKCFDQPSTLDASVLQQWDCNHTWPQRFTRTSYNGAFYTFKGQHSGKCIMTVGSGSGTQITQGTCQTTPDARTLWTLTAKTTNPTTYEVRSAAYGGMCLDVTKSGTGSGTKIQLYACNGTGAQRFTITTV